MKIYKVGGAVRDFLQGITPRDTDYVVVGATVEEMLAKNFTQVGADFPVFLHPQTHEEYALARTERKSGKGYGGFTTETKAVTLEEDLSRRDITINAMALDEQGTLIDPYGGKRDLEGKVLRHVSPAFAEDPLRVLRVARFMARFGPQWRIASETMALMVDMVSAGTLDELSRERIWVEIEKGLKEPHAHIMLDVLRQLHILDRPAFAEYSGALTADLDIVARIAKANVLVPVRFAVAFLRQWSPAEAKDSRIPRDVREVAHGLALGLQLGLQSFKSLSPVQKVDVLVKLDALRQKDRMRYIIDALAFLHAGQRDAIHKALAAIESIDTANTIAGLTDGKAIREKLHNARVEAVAAL